MQMNPRPAKSLNKRPIAQMQGESNITQAQPILHQTALKRQNIMDNTVLPKPSASLTRNVPLQSAINTKQDFMGQHAPETTASTMVSRVTSGNPLVAFVARMSDIVGSFAILSDDVLAQNISLATNGFSVEDRTLPYEIAEYLMSNMAYIFMGLVLDNNFKNAFMESLKVELEIDSQPENIRLLTRAKMKEDKKYSTIGSIVVGTSDFVPEIKAILAKKMQQGFTSLDGFAEEFDAEINHLTREQKLEYGFIFSNFMYLQRAFTHNDIFMSYVISVIEKVKAMTGNK